jgi:hypothetical protein
VDTALQPVTGEVKVELWRGQARAIARTGPHSLYSKGLASFDMAGYDPSHAEGFIRLFGLPLAALARAGANGKAKDGAASDAPAGDAAHRPHSGAPAAPHAHPASGVHGAPGPHAAPAPAAAAAARMEQDRVG